MKVARRFLGGTLAALALAVLLVIGSPLFAQPVRAAECSPPACQTLDCVIYWVLCLYDECWLPPCHEG